MRVLFCGGGTAGHITPAIAIAQAIKIKDKRSQILFVGRTGGNENRAVTSNGYALTTINIRGFERKLTFKNLKNAFIAFKSLGEAKKIIKSFSPDVVVGTGGYVSWPVLKSAVKMNIPSVIHESNASPGFVTKLLSGKCDLVLLNLSGSEKEFPKKHNIMIVGNPVREEFTKLTRDGARKKIGILQNELLITSFGGSGGSEAINREILNLMKIHSSRNPGIRHIHATGEKYFKSAKDKYPSFANGKNGCLIKSYIDNMPELITASDIVISRSGAMSLAELSAAGVAAILIPSPNVADDHQRKNADLLTKAGAAIMIEEKDLNERTLTDAVYRLESDEGMRKRMQKEIKKFYFKDSAHEIADAIISLSKSNSAVK